MLLLLLLLLLLMLLLLLLLLLNKFLNVAFCRLINVPFQFSKLKLNWTLEIFHVLSSVYTILKQVATLLHSSCKIVSIQQATENATEMATATEFPRETKPNYWMPHRGNGAWHLHIIFVAQRATS